MCRSSIKPAFPTVCPGELYSVKLEAHGGDASTYQSTGLAIADGRLSGTFRGASNNADHLDFTLYLGDSGQCVRRSLRKGSRQSRREWIPLLRRVQGTLTQLPARRFRATRRADARGRSAQRRVRARALRAKTPRALRARPARANRSAPRLHRHTADVLSLAPPRLVRTPCQSEPAPCADCAPCIAAANW
jgi:hypothetical protein